MRSVSAVVLSPIMPSSEMLCGNCANAGVAGGDRQRLVEGVQGARACADAKRQLGVSDGDHASPRAARGQTGLRRCRSCWRRARHALGQPGARIEADHDDANTAPPMLPALAGEAYDGDMRLVTPGAWQPARGLVRSAGLTVGEAHRAIVDHHHFALGDQGVH